MISSEGGVGRGLQPITDLLNSEMSARMGGTPTTTYSPAYTFASSERRGFIFPNHTNIGSVDFKTSNVAGIVTLWNS